MKTEDFVNEIAATELAKKLPGLEKHNYSSIDKLMKDVSKRHRVTSKMLHDLFVKKYKDTPDNWIKNKLDENVNTDKINLKVEVEKFTDWMVDQLKLKTTPVVELSFDTEEAQTGHHTGSHTVGENKIWVYAKNRNLVDILRTVAHELTHVRQGELNMIKNGSSYPGSPIEVLADAMAGKLIKIYGEKNHYIFQ